MGKENKDLIKPETTVLSSHLVELTPVSLRVLRKITYEEWAGIGRNLKEMAHGMPFWVGDWVVYGEQYLPDEHSQEFDPTKGYDTETIRGYAYTCERIPTVRRRTSLTYSHHREVASFEPKEQDYWLDKAEKENLTREELREAIKQKRLAEKQKIVIKGKYRTIVIDPPWPMEKIERKVRHRQTAYLDYPIMRIDDIKAKIPVSKIAYEDGTHIYLWTTHRFLPDAFEVFKAWGVKYECLLTWDKGGGITPFSFMYSTEFVLFGRIGSLELLKKGEKTLFKGERREHSRKPAEFYDLVRLVSPEPRINVFTRESVKGFDSYGNEVKKFDKKTNEED